MLRRLAAAAAFCTALVAGPALAQYPPLMVEAYPKILRDANDPGFAARARARFSPPEAPLPSNASALDALLARKDYAGLNTALSRVRQDDAVLLLNWERAKVFAGGGIYPAINYARDLWGVSELLPPERRAATRESAHSFGLYALALMAVDGARCADADGPARRRSQLRAEFEPIWAYGAELPAAELERAGMVALYSEAITAPLRSGDDVLCQGPPTGSAAEIAAGLDALAAAGKTPKRIASPPDRLGETYEVPLAPPSFKPAASWRPAQDALRPQLPKMLIHWLQGARG